MTLMQVSLTLTFNKKVLIPSIKYLDKKVRKPLIDNTTEIRLRPSWDGPKLKVIQARKHLTCDPTESMKEIQTSFSHHICELKKLFTSIVCILKLQ